MVGERGWRKAGLVSFFLLPALLPLLIFRVLPMLASVGVSLTEWNLLRPPVLVGLDNYLGLLSDKNFHRALVNTLYYMVGYLPLVLGGALATAVLLNSKLKGSTFFRGVYFLPVVTSWVVVALLWKWLLSPEGLLVGVSSGATLAAIAQKLPELAAGSTVLGFNYDTGERYLSIEGFLPA